MTKNLTIPSTEFLAPVAPFAVGQRVVGCEGGAWLNVKVTAFAVVLEVYWRDDLLAPLGPGWWMRVAVDGLLVGATLVGASFERRVPCGSSLCKWTLGRSEHDDGVVHPNVIALRPQSSPDSRDSGVDNDDSDD